MVAEKEREREKMDRQLEIVIEVDALSTPR